MNTADIQKRLDAMPSAMCAKGLRQPDVSFILASNKQTTLSLHWMAADSDRWSDGKYQSFRTDKDDLANLLDSADAFIAALPSIEETGKAEFIAALAKAIEIGKERHVDTDLMLPVIASWKKLSENVIEDKRGAGR